jgi:DNA polymerase III epsilon subunit-like protein
MSELVFFDLETGGLDPAASAITQIAAVAVDVSTFEELATFEAKLRFREDRADAGALEVNSYDAETWQKEAIPPLDALDAFSYFLRAHSTRECISKRGKRYPVADLAGHNAASFDMPFLRRYFAHYDLFMPAYPQVFDTLQLAKWWAFLRSVDIENLRLETLAAYFGIDYAAHDALADVRATAVVTSAILAELS